MFAVDSTTEHKRPLQLDLEENGDPTSRRLDPAHVSMLTASDLVDLRPHDPTEDLWWIRAGTRVGAATLVGASGAVIDLRVQPKVGIDRLLFLMGYASDARAWRHDWVDLPQAEDLPGAAAESLVRLAERALKSGLLQGYIAVDEVGTTVRGRIRHADQMRRHFGQIIPIEVRYDEFTNDIAENRIIKAAVRRLLRIPTLHSSTRQRLLHTLHRFAEVTDLVGGQRLPSWSPSRLNARYVPALRMAEMVLSGTSFELDRGVVRASGFMVHMPTVFEDFVTKALGHAIRKRLGGREVLQDKRWRLDLGGQVKLRPDLVWYRDSVRKQPGVVVDAKYKAARLDGFPNPDVYQMLAYCSSLGLARGHLVYAAGNEMGARYEIANAGFGGLGVEVCAHALELDQPPEVLLAGMDGLAAEITSEFSLDVTAIET